MEEKEIKKTWRAFLKDLRKSNEAEIEKNKQAQQGKCVACKIR